MNSKIHISLGSKSKTVKIYIICIILNVCYVAIEGVVGSLIGSIGLLSDAGHNLSDILTLILSVFALKLSNTKAKGKYTYGFRKLSVHISLTNSILLIAAVALIIVGAISKIIHPTTLDGSLISVTAGIGIIINGLTSYLLVQQNQNDVNNRAAYLHMLADTLVSIGVVISGFIIDFTGWTIIDPIISLVIAMIIFTSSIRLLIESFNISIDAVPKSYDINIIKKTIESCNGVILVEHIHIWSISTSEVALTAHVVVRDIENCELYLSDIKQTLCSIGISHSTIEIGTRKEEVQLSEI